MKIKPEKKYEELPKKQLILFGYSEYFEAFAKLYKKKKLPNSILLSGLKGLGKATFAYHFINFILSEKEQNAYSKKDYFINHDNFSFKHLTANTHPNFFLVENEETEKNIKIEKVRKLSQFINKSTYSKDLKIVMIDNAENLNKNSSNALLKAIEEPGDNVYFFIIYNNASKILDTIKSRCTEFKITFDEIKKNDILKNLLRQYNETVDPSKFNNFLSFDTPGNVLKYYLSLEKNEERDKLSNIFYFIDKYMRDKNPETLSFISLFIEKFYRDLCLLKKENLLSHFYNYKKVLQQLHYMKKFNLDEKNIFISIKDTLVNE